MKELLSEIHQKIATQFSCDVSVIEALNIEWLKDSKNGFTDLSFYRYVERNLRWFV